MSNPSTYRVASLRRALWPFASVFVAAAGGCELPRTVTSEIRPDTARLVLEWSTPLEGEVPAVSGVAVTTEGTVFVSRGDGGVLSSRSGAGLEPVVLPPALRARPISAIATLPDHSLAVRTPAGVGVVRVDGALAYELDVPDSPFLWGARSLAVGEGGDLLVGLAPTPGVGREDEAEVYARFHDGVPKDTVRLPRRLRAGCETGPDPHFSVGWYEDFRARYLPQVVWGAGPTQGVMAGCPAVYRFERDVGGARTTMVVSPWRPIGISEEERDDVGTTWLTMMNNRPGQDDWAWVGDTIDDRKPAFSAIIADQGETGRVWVWPAQHSGTEPAHPTWPLAGLPSVLWVETGRGTFDVFDRDGSLRGHVRLPDGFRFTAWPDTPEPVVIGDSVWAIVDGPTVPGPSVARYRVEWP